MAKEMFSSRIDADLRDALASEAKSERRSVGNMLEWILRERYSRALTERGVGRVVEVGTRDGGPDAGSIPAVAVAPRSVSADVAATVPGVQLLRPHMRKDRPALECEGRVVVGEVCSVCGAVG